MKRIHEHDRPLTDQQIDDLRLMKKQLEHHLTPPDDTLLVPEMHKRIAEAWALIILEFAEDLWAQ